MLCQLSPPDIPISDKPQFLIRIPSAFSRLCRLYQSLFSESDPYRHLIVIRKLSGGRLPCYLLNNKFYGLDPRAACLIISIAHADKGIPILRKQFLRPLLARFQFKPRCQSRPLESENRMGLILQRLCKDKDRDKSTRIDIDRDDSCWLPIHFGPSQTK